MARQTGKRQNAKENEAGVGRGAARGDSDRVLGIRVTHPDRILFAGQGVAKIDLARYFAAVANHMLPFVARRPLSLVRCPQGAEKTCFFQKHAGEGFPEEIRRVPIVEKSGEAAEYLYVEDGAGLVAAVQMGTLEFHVWGASLDALETPERMIFDLDPDEGLAFGKVREAAVGLRHRLAGFGLKSLPMVTGGKGVHVVVPLERRAGWDHVKRFAKALATQMAEEAPESYTATMAKTKRRGRIFIDWLRNERGATAIAPYCTRARPGAPVAVPVSWRELRALEAANGFHMDDVPARTAAGDPWRESAGWRQALTEDMLAKAGV